MSEPKEEHKKLICYDCMKPVPMNRALSKILHLASGMAEKVFCRRCGKLRGLGPHKFVK
jgi:hypothetical protein